MLLLAGSTTAQTGRSDFLLALAETTFTLSDIMCVMLSKSTRMSHPKPATSDLAWVGAPGPAACACAPEGGLGGPLAPASGFPGQADQSDPVRDGFWWAPKFAATISKQSASKCAQKTSHALA